MRETIYRLCRALADEHYIHTPADADDIQILGSFSDIFERKS